MRIKAQFREYKTGQVQGFVDFIINNTIVIKGANLIMRGNGMFLNMPVIKVHDEYIDVISGIDERFSKQLLKVTLAAKNNERKCACIDTGEECYYDVHIDIITKAKGPVKAKASITIRHPKEIEKSYFTINNICVIQGKKSLFVGMPCKTKNPYIAVCTFIGRGKKLLNSLILKKAKEILIKGEEFKSYNL